jgi:hypothetical protein
METSRPAPPARTDAEEAFDGLLLAVDERGRDADDERTYYQDILLLLLRDGPFSSLAVWSLDDSAATLKAVAPEENHPPAPDHCRERLLANQSVELSGNVDGTNGAPGGHTPRFIAGYRISAAEGIALDAIVRPGYGSERPRRLLEALAELIGHVETRLRYLASRQNAKSLIAADGLIQRFHSGESVVETALLIAAGLQEQLGYDRCWVCRPRRSGARVIASSAPGDVARRQALVRQVEGVAAQVIDTGRETTWSAGDSPGNSTTAFRALADEGTARRIAAFPLRGSGTNDRPIAAVVLEQFSGVSRPDEAARRRVLHPHAAQAIAAAIRSENIGWRGFLSPADSPAWRRRGIVALVLAAGLVFLALPVPFDVEAEGQLVPSTSRSIFAPLDGVVMTIHTRHGESVRVDEPLLELRSPDLDRDRERIAGQISELKAKLSALQVLRAQGRRPAGESAADLSAQEEQIQATLRGAEHQESLIGRQLDQLAIRSPIAGVVDRWDLEESLAARPVVRGQHLCDVLDVAGAWKLDLHIPDKHAGIVLAARSVQADLPVRFRLRADPTQEHPCRLSTLAERTELDAQGGLRVRATADIASNAPVSRRAGASVVAHIECGRRSRASVWFHELWNAIALWWL